MERGGEGTIRAGAGGVAISFATAVFFATAVA